MLVAPAEALARASQEGLLEIHDASATMLNGKAFEGEVLGQLTNQRRRSDRSSPVLQAMCACADATRR